MYSLSQSHALLLSILIPQTAYCSLSLNSQFTALSLSLSHVFSDFSYLCFNVLFIRIL